MNESNVKPMSKANMAVVDELLTVIDDWREVIIPRHVKFVDAYFKYKKNLKMAGFEFYFTESDMLFIFWRIQKTLQEEYSKRVKEGKIRKQAYIYKVSAVPRKKKVIRNESEMITNLCEFRKSPK